MFKFVNRMMDFLYICTVNKWTLSYLLNLNSISRLKLKVANNKANVTEILWLLVKIKDRAPSIFGGSI